MGRSSYNLQAGIFVDWVPLHRVFVDRDDLWLVVDQDVIAEARAEAADAAMALRVELGLLEVCLIHAAIWNEYYKTFILYGSLFIN